MFADKYLLKNQNVPIISDDPCVKTGIIVVIPCLNEPGILNTLESLLDCDKTAMVTEVIVLINHSEHATKKVAEQNKKTRWVLDDWMQKHSVYERRFYAIGPVLLRKKWAGAGLARKKGMDEAVRRFNTINKPEGIIVSLDADTVVEKNYLVEIQNHFVNNSSHVGATIAFEHPKKALNSKHREGIELYEKYLRYYKEALAFTGYPYAMFTIGSAFAVTADAYVKRGGMNRRQAGEDFYFLQNLVQIGEVGEISSTRVYPSARLSDRVPFGTGPILAKWMNGEDNLLHTYNFQSFIDLKLFLDRKYALYKIDREGFQILLKTLPESISLFLHETEFLNDIEELNRNCASPEAFINRFFQKFNAFKVLKYLNFVQEKFYPAANLINQINQLENHCL